VAPGSAQPQPAWNVRITDVRYWDGANWQLMPQPCGTPPPLQRITIAATSPSGQVNLSRQFVKGPTS
jgi:hypothetical protein